MGGGVASFPIAAQGPGLLNLTFQETVDERGFSHPGGPDEGDCSPLLQVWIQLLEPPARQRVGADHGQIKDDAPELSHPDIEVGTEIDLVEQNHRLGAALEDRREVALDPAQIEIPVQS